MKVIMNACLLAWTALIVCSNCLQAQSVDEVLQKFPNDHAVFLKVNRDTKIYLKDNLPVAESTEESEMLVLSDRANGIYNKYKVFHGSFDELTALNAYTNVPDGNKYRKIKVIDIKTQNATSRGVFYDDMKESVFDFPSLVKGALANETHTEFHKDPHLLSPFYFTSYMPVVNSKVTITFPSTMQVKYIIKNDAEKSIQVKEEKHGKQTVYEFTATNLKSRDRYGDGPARSYYEPHVIIHLASYKNEAGEQVSYLGSVDDLYKWNYGFLKEVNTKSSTLLKHLADSLTAGITSDREKTRQIYRWVQDNIKYVAFEEGLEGFTPRQAADVCTKRYGDCKDMASLLTALLKLSGIKAYFTWIGTRDIPYEYNEVPLPITDNHMISTANINDEWIFLDGTDPNCIFGTPSKAIQGKQALVGMNDKEYKLIKVPEISASKNYMVDSTFISLSDNGIKGNSSVYFNGYFGVDFFNTMLYQDNKDIKEYIKGRMNKGSNKFNLQNFSVNRFSNTDKIMNIKTNFDVPDYGKKIADELYINLALDRYANTSLIDTAKRRIAIDNDFRFHVKNYTILDVPQDYEVSYMPENYSFKNNLFAFNVKYSQAGGKIIAEQEFQSDVMMLETKEFGKWNETIKELNIQRKKQLVLKKK
jgi:hypothetical protein